MNKHPKCRWCGKNRKPSGWEQEVGQTLLNVNINMQTAHDLKDISSREKLSITETVRRLVPMGAYIYRALLDGYNVQVVGPDGRVSKVVFDV